MMSELQLELIHKKLAQGIKLQIKQDEQNDQVANNVYLKSVCIVELAMIYVHSYIYNSYTYIAVCKYVATAHMYYSLCC